MSKSIYKLSVIIFLIIGFLFLSESCRREEKAPIVKKTDSTAAKLPPAEIKITYRIYATGDSAVVERFFEAYTESERDIILALNRLDYQNIPVNDTLIAPDTFFVNLLRYTPFPKQVKLLDSIPKILLFSYPIQAFAAYDSGHLIRWGPVSMGKRSTPTPVGLFHTNWKAKQTISTDNEEWLLPWYFNLENKRGVSIHQFELPGYPASHACARLRAEDAEWIYYWADQWIITDDGESIVAYGTPVIIFGSYDFKAAPPWKFLAENPDTAKYTESDLENVVNEHLSVIKERQETRDSVITARIKSPQVKITGGIL